MFSESNEGALEFSGKPRHAPAGHEQGFSSTYGLREAQIASVRMKQNSFLRVPLGQILHITSFALALGIVREVQAGDEPSTRATDSGEMQFGGLR